MPTITRSIPVLCNMVKRSRVSCDSTNVSMPLDFIESEAFSYISTTSFFVGSCKTALDIFIKLSFTCLHGISAEFVQKLGRGNTLLFSLDRKKS